MLKLNYSQKVFFKKKRGGGGEKGGGGGKAQCSAGTKTLHRHLGIERRLHNRGPKRGN